MTRRGRQELRDEGGSARTEPRAGRSRYAEMVPSGPAPRPFRHRAQRRLSVVLGGGDCGPATIAHDACDHRRIPREPPGPKTGQEQALLTSDGEHEEAVLRGGGARKNWC